jgi:hypothetical protein
VLSQRVNTAHALGSASFLVCVSMLIVMHGMPPEVPSYEQFESEADMSLVRVKAACILTWLYISPDCHSNRFRRDLGGLSLGVARTTQFLPDRSLTRWFRGSNPRAPQAAATHKHFGRLARSRTLSRRGQGSAILPHASYPIR